MFGSLALDAQLGSQHQQAARSRKLARLRYAVEVAQDPSDIFEATTDLIEAMVDSGALFRSTSPCQTSGTSTGASPAGGETGRDADEQSVVQQQAHEEQMLAMTLCAALSESALKQGEVSGASLASLSATADAGASPSTNRDSPTSTGQHANPAVSTTVPAPAAAQLQLQHSLPVSHNETDGGFVVAPAIKLPAPGLAFPLPMSLSTARVDANMRCINHPARSAHSCMLAQDVLQFRQQLQRSQAQQQQQPAHADPYYQVKCQQLLVEAAMELQHQQLWQQQQAPAFQQQQLLLSRQQQLQAHHSRTGRREQQQKQLPDTDRTAALLDRLKRAIAETSARNRMAQS